MFLLLGFRRLLEKFYDPKKIIKIESKLIFPKDLRIRAFAFVVSKNSSILVTSIGSGKFLARRELLQEAKALVSNLKYGEIVEDTIDENLILQDPIVTKSSIEKKVDKDINKIEVSDQIEEVDDFYLPGIEMDIAMRGNPWNVPRGFPGSHSMELLNHSLDNIK